MQTHSSIPIESRLLEVFDALWDDLVDPREAYADVDGGWWSPVAATSEQIKSAVSELFTYQFQGYANLGLNTRTSISGNTLLPAVQFDLAVNLPLFNFGNAEAANDNGLTVDFRNVAIDLGSFLNSYVQPILATANDVIAPIKLCVR